MPLKRQLGLFDATILVVGNVVGAGIFTTSGLLAQELPHPWLFIIIWFIGGVLTLAGALTYAEMASALPYAGGDYQFLKAAYGHWAGFLLGWLCFWVIFPGSIAALSIALIKYIQVFLPTGGQILEKIMAISVIFLLSLINYRGIRLGATAQNLFTLGNLFILFSFIALGLIVGRGNWENLQPGTIYIPFSKLFGPGMIAVIFTYSGWFASAYIGSEIKNPGKNLPLSLIIGTCIVTLFYTLINLTYLYATPISGLKNTINVAEKAAVALFDPRFAYLISMAIILAISASINATILTGARIYYAMAKDNTFLKCLGKAHPYYYTPYVAIITQAVLSIVFVILGSFKELLSYVVFAMLLSSIATGSAHFVLRLKKPDLPRVYHTWGYPFTPLLFIGFYIWIACQIFWSRPYTSILGLGIAFSGVPFYVYRKFKLR